MSPQRWGLPVYGAWSDLVGGLRRVINRQKQDLPDLGIIRIEQMAPGETAILKIR